VAALVLVLIVVLSPLTFGAGQAHSTAPPGMNIMGALEPRAYLPMVVNGYPPDFQLGGHIRDLNLPHADRMHYAGMNWVKTQVTYGEDASDLIAAAHSQDFKIQLTARGSANQVTQPGFNEDFAFWVEQLAAAGADAIEVWNEPNIDREWQTGHISPTLYTNLLCASYTAIKAANSKSLVISAAPAPTGWFGGCSPAGCDDLPWLEGL